MSECASKGCGCSAGPIIQPTIQAPLTTESAQEVYRIENMDCPTEEALIRGKLVGLAGVVGLEFNLMQRTLAVRHELPSLFPVEQALTAIGMQAVRMDQASTGQTTKLSITCASNPSVCSATSTSGRTWSAWRTDSVRCIRLKSRSATPAIVPSFLRINASSVGQSILAIDSLVVCPADA